MNIFGYDLSLQSKYRNRWGLPNCEYKSHIELFEYFNAKKSIVNTDIVDDHTWSDLDMQDFFEKVDVCVCPIGREYLYSRLKGLESNNITLENRYEIIKFWPEQLVGRAQANLQDVEKLYPSIYNAHWVDVFPMQSNLLRAQPKQRLNLRFTREGFLGLQALWFALIGVKTERL